MTTLKELTAEKHKEAENQPFLKTIFAGNVDRQKYSEYLYQLLYIYNVLENKADDFKLFEGIEDIKRAKQIELDWVELARNDPIPRLNASI